MPSLCLNEPRVCLRGQGWGGSLPSSGDLIQDLVKLAPFPPFASPHLPVKASPGFPDSSPQCRSLFQLCWGMGKCLRPFSPAHQIRSAVPGQTAGSPSPLSSGAFGKSLGITRSWPSHFFFTATLLKECISQPSTQARRSMHTRTYTHAPTSFNKQYSILNPNYLWCTLFPILFFSFLFFEMFITAWNPLS